MNLIQFYFIFRVKIWRKIDEKRLTCMWVWRHQEQQRWWLFCRQRGNEWWQIEVCFLHQGRLRCHLGSHLLLWLEPLKVIVRVTGESVVGNWDWNCQKLCVVSQCNDPSYIEKLEMDHPLFLVTFFVLLTSQIFFYYMRKIRQKIRKKDQSYPEVDVFDL